MSGFLQLTLVLAIIIMAAKIGGYISTHYFRQPAVLGELIVGLLLGPSALDMLHWPFLTDHTLGEQIRHMAELGVLILMMLAGMELNLADLIKAGKESAFTGVLGVVAPLLIGWGAAALFGFETNVAVFIGLTLAATSVSISAQTLIELGQLRSRVGLVLLGAAVFDDILVILVLSVFFALLSGGSDAGGGAVALVIGRMVGYLLLASVIGIWVLPRLAKVVHKLRISQGIIAFTLVACLLFAWSAEVAGGIAAITGAFLVGLFMGRTPYKHEIETRMVALAYAFLVPIFLVNIGLEANILELDSSMIWFTVAICLVAVLSKIIGSGLGALMSGVSKRESLQLGIGMVSRGEVGLIVGSVGLVEGLITSDIFAAVVVMVIVTTLVTPPALRASFVTRKSDPPPKKPAADDGQSPGEKTSQPPAAEIQSVAADHPNN